MWLGRLLGLVFGYMVFHLPGAILGFIVGNAFDRGIRLHRIRLNPAKQQAVQQAFFKATFQIMGHIAKADGHISEDEINIARTIMMRMNLNTQQQRRAIDFFNEGKEPDFSLNDSLHALLLSCQQQRLLLRMFVEIQYEAAAVDGFESPKKRQALNYICDHLNISPMFRRFESAYGQSHRASHKAHQHGNIQDDYRLLNITQSATDAEIKKAYRKQISQHHPDKLVSQGLPEEMIKMANEKTHQIKSAYERIRHSKGF